MYVWRYSLPKTVLFSLLIYPICFRLRSSAVLVVGLTGLTAELIKNIVLAGIKSLTLIDHRHGDENTIQTVQGATFLLLPEQRNKDTPVSYHTLNHMWLYLALCGVHE